MPDLLERTITKDEQEEIKEMVDILTSLSKQDRVILLSNANAFKVRNNLEELSKNTR